MLSLALVSLISSSPRPSVQATLFGKQIRVDKVTVMSLGQARTASGKDVDIADTFEFSFQEGTEFVPDKKVSFFFNKQVGRSWNGFSWSQAATKFGTDAYSKAIHGHKSGSSCGRGVMAAFLNYSDGNSKTKNESCSDEIQFKFSSKKLKNGRYLGVIDAYVVKHNSRVKGEFEFLPQTF